MPLQVFFYFYTKLLDNGICLFAGLVSIICHIQSDIRNVILFAIYYIICSSCLFSCQQKQYLSVLFKCLLVVVKINCSILKGNFLTMLSKYSQVQFYFKDHVKRNIMVQSKFILDTQSKIYDFLVSIGGSEQYVLSQRFSRTPNSPLHNPAIFRRTMEYFDNLRSCQRPLARSPEGKGMWKA